MGVYILKRLTALVKEEGYRLRVAVVDRAAYPRFAMRAAVNSTPPRG